MEAYKKETIFVYESNTSAFEKKFQENLEKYGQVDVDKFVSELKGPKVLDAGCGPGVYLEALREKGVDGIGIDLSDAFIDRCHEKGLNVRKMDMESPILYPQSFDGIWAHAVLMHVPKERVPALVQTWSRLLKRDGLLWVSTKEGVGEGFETGGSPNTGKRWLTLFSDDEIKRLFGKKFEIVHSYTQNDSGKTYMKYLFRLKPDVKPAFRNF